MEKQWNYEVRHWQGVTSSYRILSAPSTMAAFDKAMILFVSTWGEIPDKIDIKRQDTYIYK